MKLAILGTYHGILIGRYIEAFIKAGIEIDCIIVDSKSENPRDLKLYEDRTRGRLPPLPLHLFANAKIPLFVVGDHNDIHSIDLVKCRNIDLLINAGTPRILQRQLLNSPKFGVLNSHPGILPDFRGSSCVEWALLKGARVGNSIHLMDVGIDEGDLLMVEEVSIPEGASYSSIRISVYLSGIDLMIKACQGIIQGSYSRSSFKIQSKGTYYRSIDEESMIKIKRLYPE